MILKGPFGLKFSICAVSGGTYILGRNVISLTRTETSSDASVKPFSLRLEDVPETLTADLLITSSQLLPKLQLDNGLPGSTRVSYEARGIVILDRQIQSITSSLPAGDELKGPDEMHAEDIGRPLDSALLIIPSESGDSSVPRSPINILLNGEGTLACPGGRSK